MRPFRRCAILASHEAQADGLSDLLTVEISVLDEIELVEREQLDRATRELELSALLGSVGTAKRLRLGQVVKADVLLLLTVEEHEGNRFLKLVVAGVCTARGCGLEYLRYDPKQRQRIAKRCASAVQATNRRVPVCLVNRQEVTIIGDV